MSPRESRIPSLMREDVRDVQLQEILDNAEKLSTPKPAWYLTLAHNPEMAKAYAAYWDLTHRGGKVDHKIKELMRIAIAQLMDCDFCADQRSVVALEQGLEETEARVCSLPEFNHPDPRTNAALRYARALVLDSTDDQEFDEVYAELRKVFDASEIVELGCFAAIAIGGVRLSRSLSIRE